MATIVAKHDILPLGAMATQIFGLTLTMEFYNACEI